MKTFIKENVPFAENIPEDYDPQSEIYIITEGFANLKNVLKRPDGPYIYYLILNKIYHLNNKLKLLFKYPEKYLEPELIL